jgi:hypothetical protein
MKVTIEDKKEILKDYNLKNIVSLVDNSNLFLVDESELTFSNTKAGVNKNNKFYIFFKIQFIVKCDIDLINDILVAFYIDEGGILSPYILSELPAEFRQFNVSNFFLIDYNSYCDFCKITGQKTLTLGEYIDMKKGFSFSKSLLKYEDKYYNSDQSQDIFKKLEED